MTLIEAVPKKSEDIRHTSRITLQTVTYMGRFRFKTIENQFGVAELYAPRVHDKV